MNIHRVSAPATLVFFVVISLIFAPSGALAAGTVTPAPHPVYISIATSGTNASVIPVGVTKTNNLDVPHNFVQAGWYKYGETPGQIGNAVIDGHVDNGASIPGIFKHLDQVKIGDIITITMSDNTALRFKVTDSSIYKDEDFPSESVFVGDGLHSVLKIITCNGTYIPSQHTYDKRLIVTAVLVP